MGRLSTGSRWIEILLTPFLQKQKTKTKKNPTASNGIPVASFILHVSFISMWQVKFTGITTATILFMTYVFSAWHWWWLLFLLPNIAVNAILNRSSSANNHRFGLSLKSSSMRDLTWHSLCLSSFSLNFVFISFFLQLRYLTMTSSLCQTIRLKVVSIVWLISWTFLCLCFLLLSFLFGWSPLPVSFLALCPCLFSLQSWGDCICQVVTSVEPL